MVKYGARLNKDDLRYLKNRLDELNLDILTYKNINLVEKCELELIYSNQSKFLISSAFNKLKHIRMSLRSIISKPKKGNQNKILFLLYTNSHINNSRSIINELGEKALVVKKDGFTNHVAKKLKRNNIEFNDIEGYDKSKKNISTAEKSLDKAYNELVKEDKIEKPMLKYMFKSYFPEVIKYIELINNMLEFEKPKLLVVMNEITTLGNIAVSIAKEKKIQTLCIQHGAIANNPGSFVPVSVDKVAVWGEYSKKVMMEHNTPEEKIVITGAPQFDILKDYNKGITPKIAKEIGLDITKKYVLITTQNYPFMEDVLRSVCNTVKLIPELQLVIKTHPSEYFADKYVKIAQKSGIKSIVTSKYLYPLLKSCSAMITVSSTTGMEALMMKKPVITVNYTGSEDPMPYAENGAAIGVYKEEELLPAIKAVINNDDNNDKINEIIKKSKNFLYDRCHVIDGNASQRIVELIHKISN